MFARLSNLFTPTKSAANSSRLGNGDQDAAITGTLVGLDGLEEVEIFERASIEFEDSLFVASDVEHDSETAPVEFVATQLRNFAQDDLVRFRWCMKRSDGLHEYGLILDTPQQGQQFRDKVQSMLVETSQEVCRLPVTFTELDHTAPDTQWATVAEQAVLTISQRASDQEAFLSIRAFEGPEGLLYQETLSNDLNLRPSANGDQLSFFGAERDGSGNRRMYAVVFTAVPVPERESFLAKLDETLVEKARRARREAGEGDMYDDDMFDAEDQGEAEEMDWEEAEEHRQTPVKCKPDRVGSDEDVHFGMCAGTDRTYALAGTPQKDRRGGYRTKSVKVYRPNPNSPGGLEQSASIHRSRLAWQGEQFDVAQSLLFDSEEKFVLRPEHDPHSFYLMDIERETVVAKYENDIPMHNVMPSYKGAEKRGTQHLVGHSSRAFFKLDTKVGPRPRQHTLTYASNPQFTCGATTEDEEIVLGNKMGEFRLYDGKPNRDGKYKIAKTLVSGLGDPLTAVTATRDGHWIVGTTDHYLVVLPVKLRDSDKTGFQKSLGKLKPRPYKLSLKNEDWIRYKLTDVCFTPAHFSYGADGEENGIITSTGSMAVIWNFMSVKQGRLDDYKTKVLEDFIMATQVPVDMNQAVVMTMQHSVACERTVSK
ncbi:unnamed protein product [Vitrella brassicaformis CCMP3155]|uniref:Vacuolar import/degradation Vid27 C-terminal domain-containing protein n=1 Tax=Vitrella brassicaformis (strain CCMP3155) TaxID=1169540 RepID=A0A0G4EH88_VITBC|nr:unnamed protein product [Vitrella brassicaformis CCMP3155]|eukprot:CEL95385.1 unnamed protein product [Vitrella brassicaformis CCMP3155]